MARILVVEDDAVTAGEIQSELLTHGHEVTVAGNGTAALELARTRKFQHSAAVSSMRVPTVVTHYAVQPSMSLNRYQKGVVSYLDVVTAQATALRTRRTALDLRTRALRASIALAEALGGDWHDRVAEAGRNSSSGG